MPTGKPLARYQSGAAFLWALTVLFVLILAAGKLLELQTTRTQRFLEDELLWTGEQYRAAIKRYHAASPGEVKQLPRTIGDLQEDRRLLTLTRHLRQAYLDPMTKQPFDEIHDLAGNLIGVRSSSKHTVIKASNFPAKYASFAAARTYHEWEFIFLP